MSKGKEKTASEKLMEIVNELPLFRDSSGKGWARANGRCYPVRSSQFKRWLQWKYYDFYQKAPHSQAIQDVLDQAAGKALFDSDPEEVNVRVSKQSETIIIDQGKEHGTSKVEITAVGWQEGTSKTSNFWRPKGMNSLPRPVPGGTINALRKYLNVKSDSDYRLLIAWLLAAHNPEIACPILVLQGEQGSAKSTTAKVLRSLIDPNGALIRSAPRDEREMIIQAQNSRILCLDNLSGLKKWLSDALCRICSGTGFSTRRLYTNNEEEIYKVKRPIILNGIDDIATRGDLLDRAIVLNLPAIPDSERRDERQFWKDFKQEQPYVLGALYSAMSTGLAAAKPRLKELPRMADFAEWVTRCESAFEWSVGTIVNDYNSNKREAIEAGLDSDYLASAIRKILQRENQYQGTATALLEEIRKTSPDVREKHLPTIRTLKNKLQRLAPALRKIGIEYEYKRTNSARLHILERVRDNSTPLSPMSQNGYKNDARDDSDESEIMPSKNGAGPSSDFFGEPSL